MLSKAPSQGYKPIKRGKKARGKRETYSLPKHLKENMQFGVSSLPSDNMHMVMQHTFGEEFDRKQ